MKITYISNSILPSRTANSIHVMKMCQAFADNGHEVTLLAPDSKEQYEESVTDIFEFYGVRENFKVIRLFTPKIKGKTLIYTFGILKQLLFNKTDLVYGRFIIGCYLSSLLKIKTIFESHSPITDRSTLEVFLFERLIRKNNFVKLVVISQALKDFYLKNKKLCKSRIQVAHDGADAVLDFNSKAKLNGANDNLKVGYVGHLYHGKGIEVIEKIHANISKNVEFHIVGGLTKDIDYWKAKIKSNNVYFYGFVPQNEVSRYINALDICLLPNQSIVKTAGSKDGIGSNIADFTSPLKMFEYMAHKKAIVASDQEVLKEVLNSGNSVLVNPEDGGQWIKAIESLNDANYRRELSFKAHEDSMKYSWINRAKSIISF